MPIIAKETGGTYTPAPAGVHQAVCCDVVDMGLVETNFNNEKRSAHKIRIIWEIDETMDDGKRFTASRRYTLSLHEKASLRKDLESWRGRSFTSDELKGFDLEKLLGVNCQLNIVHTSRNGKGPYADVTAIMPTSKGMQKLIASLEYIRIKDRKPDGATPNQSGDAYDPTDEEIPF